MIIKTKTDVSSGNIGIKGTFDDFKDIGNSVKSLFQRQAMFDDNDIQAISDYNREFTNLLRTTDKYTAKQEAVSKTMGKASKEAQEYVDNIGEVTVNLDEATKASKAAEFGMKALAAVGAGNLTIPDLNLGEYLFIIYHKPACWTPYTACSCVNPPNSNWLINSLLEKLDQLRYDFACFAACSFQSAPQLFTPYSASSLVNPPNSNCSINPLYENEDDCKYDLACFKACSFQSAPQLSTPYVASSSLNPSYCNCSIKPL